MSTTTQKKSATAPEPGTALVAAALPAQMVAGYADVIKAAQTEAAAMTRADFSMPFLGIVQSLSPQRQKGDEKYIAGAEEGDLFNTVTGELFKADAGLRVIPVKYALVFNVWRPRDLGGGFLGSFPSQIDPKGSGKDLGQEAAITCAVSFIMSELADVKDPAAARELAVRRGKEGWVRDTANQYVLARSADGSWAPALLSLTSTKLTPGRKWNTVIQMRKPSAGRVSVRWNDAWQVQTVLKKNEEGVFYNLRVPEPAGETDAAEWRAAADFYAALKLGHVKVEYEKSDETPPTDETGPAM